MLATVSNVPKWLLAIVAVCILTGYYQQVECKLTGCKSTVVASSGDGDEGSKSTPQHEDQHCQCQCHFLTLSLCEMPPLHVSFVRAVSASALVWVDNAPEAPCMDIEHPPQLA